MSVFQLEVEQVHADLQAVARLALTAAEVPVLTFTEYCDELGPGVQAFVQLAEGTFRLWNNSTDPVGRSLVVLASAGEPLPKSSRSCAPWPCPVTCWLSSGTARSG